MRPILVIALLAMASPAAAQKFEYGKFDDVKDVKDVEWKATAEAGVMFTTGNSETTNATGGIKVSRKTGDNKLTLEGSGAYARAGLFILFDRNGNGMIDDESEITTVETTTAETLAGKLRYDRFLTDLNSLFIAALASRDVPAGKAFVFGGQAGYSRSLYKSKTALTLGEFGYDFSREDLVAPGKALSIHSLRAFIGHKATMTEGTDLDASAELLSNVNRLDLPTGKNGGPFRDTRLNVKIAISAKIGLNLAFQTSLEVKFDNRPSPLGIKTLAMGFAPEASKLDTIMKGSFIYTFVGTNK
ncbi:MAG TPA: DUF481 domain-containing protein [Kofleriaceae bacterium]